MYVSMAARRAAAASGRAGSLDRVVRGRFASKLERGAGSLFVLGVAELDSSTTTFFLGLVCKAWATNLRLSMASSSFAISAANESE
jgi:hypothetical protein